MDILFKKIIQFLLKWLAKIYLWRVKPIVFVVAGTTNRHWIKEAIINALKEKELDARGSRKNFNAEIGLPLSILDLPSGEGSFSGWLKIIQKAIQLILNFKFKISNYLVLEMAINKPDDIDYLLSIVKPNVLILTTITMVYRENFEDLDEIALEYKKMVQALPKDGLLLLNFDDERIRGLADFSPCKTLTYGLEEGSDYWAKNIKKEARGLRFEICVNKDLPHKNSLFGQKTTTKECELAFVERFGKHHIYAKIVSYVIETHIANFR